MEFTQGQPIRLPPPPDQLPAQRLRFFCPDRPEVITGQTIRRGQFLIQPLRLSDACFVSPITGTVRTVTPQHGGGYSVEIEPPGETVVTSLEVAPPRGRKLDNWFAALRQVGPWADPDGGVGLIAQLDAARGRPVESLVCVGLDPFPPYPNRSSLLMSFPDDAVLGTLILADLLNVKRVVMLSGRVPATLSRLRSSCRKYRLRLVTQNNRYPAAHPTSVAYTLGSALGTHRFLPQRHNPVEQGLMMITPWTAIRIGRWFTLRRFDLARPVFIARPDHQDDLLHGYYALQGQPLRSLDPHLAYLDDPSGGDVIAGDPLSGRLLPRPHVIPADQSLLTVLPPRRPTIPEPCINCGWCLDVCPTQLDPVKMLQAAQTRQRDAWLCEQLPWCIECGLCSYVCPAAIPLAQGFAKVQQQMESAEGA
jgi:electron transport complex protein RnfC